MELLLGTGFSLIIIIIAITMFLHFVPLGLWISAIAANVNVGIFTLVGMRLRRVVPQKIVLPLIKANKAGLSVSVNQLEAHYLAFRALGGYRPRRARRLGSRADERQSEGH